MVHTSSTERDSTNNLMEEEATFTPILNQEQRKAFDLIIKGENVHICGAAGTGKSHLLTIVYGSLRHLKLNVAVTAPTGVAANNLNESCKGIDMKATTIHSWIGAGLFDGSFQENLQKIKSARAEERWKSVDVLIIDEISMVSPKLFDDMDLIARTLRGNSKPFGGIQMVLCGDWFQLEPVRDNRRIDEKYEDIDYCFETDLWNKTIKEENIIELCENYRQKTDPQFQKLLDEIREGILTEESIILLKSRINASLENPAGIRPTLLLPLVWQVKKENDQALAEIQGEKVRYTWQRFDHNIEKKEADKLFQTLVGRIPVDEKVYLKVGAPVMLLVNLSVEDGFVNGMQGVVVEFDTEDGLPLVQFANGKKLKIFEYQWCKKGRKNIPGSFSGVCIKQIPIKLAAAMTIHKSQSISLDFVRLNLGKNTFAGGMAYTGLSRCRTLNGLSLIDFHISSIRVNTKVIQFHKRFSALKHRLIDDGSECGVSRTFILEMLKKHIPSALSAPSSAKRKRANREMMKKNNIKEKKQCIQQELEDEEECPL